MQKQTFRSSIDGLTIYYYQWTNVENAKGVVHIVHGTNEYAERYDAFAKMLNQKGFLVYAMELRGHGETGKHSQFGFFAKRNGAKIVYHDLHQLNKIINNDYPNLPIFLFGHSLGSFVVRGYVNYYDDVAKLIIMGTNYKNRFLIWIFKFLAGFIALFKPRKEGKFLASLSYKKLNEQFINEHKYAWISYSQDNWQAHENTKYPKFTLTNSAFFNLAQWMRDYHRCSKLAKINPKLPILLISGQDDVVGDFGKGVEKSHALYNKHGFDSKMILYPNMRHEILHEKDRQKVYFDIVKFLD